MDSSWESDNYKKKKKTSSVPFSGSTPECRFAGGSSNNPTNLMGIQHLVPFGRNKGLRMTLLNQPIRSGSIGPFIPSVTRQLNTDDVGSKSLLRLFSCETAFLRPEWRRLYGLLLIHWCSETRPASPCCLPRLQVWMQTRHKQTDHTFCQKAKLSEWDSSLTNRWSEMWWLATGPDRWESSEEIRLTAMETTGRIQTHEGSR